MFSHRLGSTTPRAVSGTAEEIQRSVSAGKPVHLYYGELPVPYDGDLDQFRALKAFRREMQKLGLVDTFRTELDLSDKIIRAISYDLPSIRIAADERRSLSAFEEGLKRADSRPLRKDDLMEVSDMKVDMVAVQSKFSEEARQVEVLAVSGSEVFRMEGASALAAGDIAGYAASDEDTPEIGPDRLITVRWQDSKGTRYIMRQSPQPPLPHAPPN